MRSYARNPFQPWLAASFRDTAGNRTSGGRTAADETPRCRKSFRPKALLLHAINKLLKCCSTAGNIKQ